MKRRLWVFLIIVALAAVVICGLIDHNLFRSAIHIKNNQHSPYPANSDFVSSSPTPQSILGPNPTCKTTRHTSFDLSKAPTYSPSPELHFPTLIQFSPVKIKAFPQVTIRPRQKIAYLTFDDGPAPVGVKPTSGTPKLLAILERHKIRATFFMIGRNIFADPQLARQVVADGNAVGNHTWSHINFEEVKGQAFQNEVEYTNEEIFDVTGVHTHLLRPPGGRHPDKSQLAILKKDRMNIFWWNVDSGDWAGNSNQQILASIQKGIRTKKNLVILFHDYAFGALDQTITLLQKNGYAFDTLDHFKDFGLPVALQS